MKEIVQQSRIGDIKVLKKRIVSSLCRVFEIGDKVRILGVSVRGYDLQEVNSGTIIQECGWDLFED